MTKSDLFQPVDAEVRAQGQAMIRAASAASLSFLQPGTLLPSVTRVALATDRAGHPVALISTLASHTAALESNPNCALLIGDPGPKGDPLTHPRLTLHCTAEFVLRDNDGYANLRAFFLEQRPKSKLYIDFPDFRFVRFIAHEGLMNGGFAKAYRFTPQDLVPI
ncbi:MAG: pyridoxamine 5'-phosphate oxidase family protein [Pelagimonas sp.]